MPRTDMRHLCQLEIFEECLYEVDLPTLDKNDDMFLIPMFFVLPQRGRHREE
jgi:hypothetical protein